MEPENAKAYRRASGLVMAVSVLLVVNAIACGVGASSGLLEIQLLDAMNDGYEVGEAKVQANDIRQMIIGLVQISIFIPLSILFLRFLWRANHNARALVDRELRYSAGSCVWWFFVPIANLFKPLGAVKEIWITSDPTVDSEQNAGGYGLLHSWWLVWIGSTFLGRMSWRLSSRAEEIGEMITASWVTMSSDVVGVLLSVLALGVVQSIYRMQEHKVSKVFGGQGDQGDPDQSAMATQEESVPKATASPIAPQTVQ